MLTVRRLSRAIRTASSNTSIIPSCVNAEHSMYFTAQMSPANLSPCSVVMGICLTLASFSSFDASLRWSIFVPTSRKGTLGQWCAISGIHFCCTISIDAGDMTLKQTISFSVGEWSKAIVTLMFWGCINQIYTVGLSINHAHGTIVVTQLQRN